MATQHLRTQRVNPKGTKLTTFTIKEVRTEYIADKISDANGAATLARQIYADLDDGQEHFTILFLNNKNRVMSYKVLFSGGMNASIIDLKIIWRNALLIGANAIIAIHNHPSGDLEPSKEDIDITRKLKQGGGILDIRVLDHIIITHDKHLSFAEMGLMA